MWPSSPAIQGIIDQEDYLELSPISVFFTLFFVVDPIGLTPFFISYLQQYEKKVRKKIILKAHIIAALVSLLFIGLGQVIVDFLGIQPSSFIVAGGVLLFLISFDMLYARPVGPRATQEPTGEEGDPSVFPLAIPMLSGPGNIAALLMFTSQSTTGWPGRLEIAGISLFVFLLSSGILLSGVAFLKFLGKTGISVMHRLIGLILSAMAVQFIVNGLRGIGFPI